LLLSSSSSSSSISFRVQASQNRHVKYSCCNSEFGTNVTKTDMLKIIVLIAVCRDVPGNLTLQCRGARGYFVQSRNLASSNIVRFVASWK
jgi:hypothetical protein